MRNGAVVFQFDSPMALERAEWWLKLVVQSVYEWSCCNPFSVDGSTEIDRESNVLRIDLDCAGGLEIVRELQQSLWGELDYYGVSLEGASDNPALTLQGLL